MRSRRHAREEEDTSHTQAEHAARTTHAGHWATCSKAWERPHPQATALSRLRTPAVLDIRRHQPEVSTARHEHYNLSVYHDICTSLPCRVKLQCVAQFSMSHTRYKVFGLSYDMYTFVQAGICEKLRRHTTNDFFWQTEYTGAGLKNGFGDPPVYGVLVVTVGSHCCLTSPGSSIPILSRSYLSPLAKCPATGYELLPSHEYLPRSFDILSFEFRKCVVVFWSIVYIEACVGATISLS